MDKFYIYERLGGSPHPVKIDGSAVRRRGPCYLVPEGKLSRFLEIGSISKLVSSGGLVARGEDLGPEDGESATSVPGPAPYLQHEIDDEAIWPAPSETPYAPREDDRGFIMDEEE